ncbi:MBOAT family O-acyltransferase [Youxingia wuxianensis]|uniref:MBOAT family protein n=1 Tax=Youxingia wuxianensis TaxID=2763678 RepID=A0A926EPG8_9FIRM|nr:MBOAT family O-acyltransferase [Youxingia wuxianensis]MBC8584164.1 MBOAT family protein [Youxingia wuxianensis]
MVFSSILFLFRFLPVTFLVYYLAPKKIKNLVLLIASLIFYSWGEVRYFPVMLVSILVNYAAGIGIDHFRGNKAKCRLLLIISIIFSVGWLAFFKYSDFVLQNINLLFGTAIPYLKLTLPLGISFYTFQIMTYTIDIYFGKCQVEKNIINFGTFVVLFPQLIAGPIVKYTDISSELRERTVTLDKVQEGTAIFIRGLASKVLLANNIGALWSEVETLGAANISTPLAWLGILAFTLQIYFDFSGYSLMAIGLGKALGFTFPQNFNYPYISRSVTEFWRRWHMTLSGWFREYLYIPLGGNRVKPARMYFNLFVVWFSTGLWHGANWNFVLWGLYFFVLISIERLFLKKYLDKFRILSHIYLILIVIFGWVLFAITDISVVGQYFSRLFSFTGGEDWIFYLRNYGVVLLLGAVLSTPALKKVGEMAPKKMRWLSVPITLLVFLVCVAYLVDASYNPFLYFRF